jgi:glycosyltransferase involved in cell wall biosynthesis
VDWPSECAVVIPCLNEAAAIEPLVAEVRKQLPVVIVIDDGSSDSTEKCAAKAGAEVIRHEQPQGKGAALQAGWRRALEQGFTWALTMDGDGQHAPSDIPEFLNCAGTSGASLVVGNRMAYPGGMPLIRRWTNRFMSGRLSRLAGQVLPDTQCGFRLMHLTAWSKLVIKTTHFEIESELLIAFARAGHKIGFVPIQVIYRAEESKIRPLQDTIRWFRWLWAR